MASQTEITYKNRPLTQAITSKYGTLYRFCSVENIDPVALGSLLCGTTFPLNEKGEMIPLVKRLCDIFLVSAQELFPSEAYFEAVMETTPAEPSTPDKMRYDAQQLIQTIRNLHPFKREVVFKKARLTFFEREVLCRRHDMDQDFPGSHEYEEIRCSFRKIKSVAEIKDIEKQTMGKLRKALRTFPASFF